jgi:hypothetical protein
MNLELGLVILRNTYDQKYGRKLFKEKIKGCRYGNSNWL